MNTTTARTTKQFADDITCAGPYYVWVGDGGYDSRPYVKGGTVAGGDWENDRALPVAYCKGYASQYIADHGDVEAGDVLGFVANLPVGAVIAVPEYYGCNYEGEERFVLAPNGWLHHSAVIVVPEDYEGNYEGAA